MQNGCNYMLSQDVVTWVLNELDMHLNSITYFFETEFLAIFLFFQQSLNLYFKIIFSVVDRFIQLRFQNISLS